MSIVLHYVRYGSPESDDDHESLEFCFRTALWMIDYNYAYPTKIRRDGKVVWERNPEEEPISTLESLIAEHESQSPLPPPPTPQPIAPE